MITINNDKTGFVVSLLDHGIHQETDPETGLPFTESAALAWEEATLGAFAADTAAAAAARAEADAVRLPDIKALKIAQIRAHFEAIVAALKADAAPYEVETWPLQQAEHSAWMANNATPTPYTTTLAEKRGIPHATLMAKIGVKVAGLATIQGMQQAMEDAVKAATTEAEVDAVSLAPGV